MQTLELRGLNLNAISSLAQAMTRTIPAGVTFGLVGTLGAGKTTLVQQIAAATGVDAGDVTSPTFTLLNSYDASIASGPITLHHMDVYRIADEDEFLELGVEELMDDPQAWTLIEWADRVESMMPRQTIWIHIDFDADSASGNADDLRSLRFASASVRFDETFQKLQRQYLRLVDERDQSAE
ncbi:tRNA (adenosine(37)-N6)-threonylcarbamoyltransferase complex ATPase subunit type 1 TsaE [Stieleria varia]|uniref:tRNA threonylcarbamoyladenosine biosynthesis protein TsaE n=1 Tax=Stieleria varia TaxID=2528005 RepID=A0A5C6B2R0_9BACT|nr:tRNA (adenosine(37)-N6)-threonylcarbamoyltransferase complex ATPase subunit type 1 TsaE [Stieleria varia]TWU04714.1 tRNA threonylcarbamoyladenosine biosynthesis protein TsaE [Stieleria varia]